jgi:acyl carrier protein
MTASISAKPRIPMSSAAVEQVVIDAVLVASPDKSVRVSRDTDVLQVVDSLGLMMSLVDIQAALNFRLEPKELIAALQAHSVADLALVITMALGARSPQVV